MKSKSKKKRLLSRGRQRKSISTGKYRSKLESKVGSLLGGDWEYEKRKVEYVLYKTYTPDFSRGDTVVEVKGFFRPGDQAKYLAIHEELANVNQTLIFIFSNPNKPVRRGAQLTHARWCERHGIEYYSVADIPKELRS